MAKVTKDDAASTWLYVDYLRWSDLINDKLLSHSNVTVAAHWLTLFQINIKIWKSSSRLFNFCVKMCRGISVTRRKHFFKNNWSFLKNEFSTIVYYFCQSRYNNFQLQKDPQTFWKVCKSAKILPNLVTLGGIVEAASAY